ncbi:Uu.00g121630.m01.CDS01 [Anthostomella pinea]|uniref:Uu.00g121630.m01.CDS01 n=1 Tax=Anthostomella pinea TaxID=933095 RepID=A0AAI8YHB5_9PEZI|nr:Uu.00g121630.m01.CDS01 [Anthostomella pinea]
MLPSPSTGITTSRPPPSTFTTSVTAPGPSPIIPTPTSTTPAPGPAAAVAGAATQPTLKRPAASDLQRSAGASATPSKRQATASSNNNTRTIPNPSPFQTPFQSPFQMPAASSSAAAAPRTQLQFQPAMPLPMPAVVTEDQLQGRSPEQLIATILQIQAQNQQYVAQINAQYDNINQQLNELRGSLVASHQAAASALTSREPVMRSIIPPPPPPLQTAVPLPQPPTIQTPSRPSRAPPVSPSHQHAVSRPSVPALQSPAAGPPQFDYRTVATVEEVWKEYREGMDGQPAIEALDAQWGSRWRPEPRGRTWYSRRKVIWDKIKDYIAEGMDEAEAVREVEMLRDGGTINKLIRMLQDERKDKGIGDDSMVG